MRMANFKYVIIFPAALLLSGLAHGADLKPYTATYSVARNGGEVGTATFTLLKTADGWSFDSQTSPTSATARLVAIDVNEHSDLRVDGDALETRSYRYRQTSIVKSRSKTIDVDAASGRIVATDKKRQEEYPYQKGVLDRQAVTLAISKDLLDGKRGTLSFNVADSHHIDVERYQVGKPETVNVPIGSTRAIVVTRLRDSPDGRVTATWFGTDNGFVPVRIVQNEPKGDVYEMRLTSLRKN